MCVCVCEWWDGVNVCVCEDKWVCVCPWVELSECVCVWVVWVNVCVCGGTLWVCERGGLVNVSVICECVWVWVVWMNVCNLWVWVVGVGVNVCVWVCMSVTCQLIPLNKHLVCISDLLSPELKQFHFRISRKSELTKSINQPIHQSFGHFLENSHLVLM